MKCTEVRGAEMEADRVKKDEFEKVPPPSLHRKVSISKIDRERNTVGFNMKRN